MVTLSCAVGNCIKRRFITEQESRGLLSSLAMKIPLSEVPIFGPILFSGYKMNKIINKFLLAGGKFIPEIHLRQPGFTYSACKPCIKNKERIKEIKETGDLRYVYQTKLDKACFQHELAHGYFKDLSRRRVSDKILHDQAFNVAENLYYHGYQRRLASMIYKCF